MSYSDLKRHSLAMAIVVLLIGSSLSWSSTAQACEVTTTVSKPTNLTATIAEHWIQLLWDAPPEAYLGLLYEILRGTGVGATPTIYAYLDETTPVYNVQTGTYSDHFTRTDFMDYTDALEAGETYVYAVVFGRVNNCGDHQRGDQSDSVTVTYNPEE